LLSPKAGYLQFQGGSNMTGTDLCANKPVRVPVIFEPPCIYTRQTMFLGYTVLPSFGSYMAWNM